MRILFLDQFSDLGGAQLNLLQILLGLREDGWKAHVTVPAHGPFIERLLRLGVDVHPLRPVAYSLGRKTLRDGVRFLGHLPSSIDELRALARAATPEILYVNGPRLMPAVAAANIGVPVVFHSHNRVTVANGKMLVDWAIVQTGATVIAASQFLGREWKHARVVYGGVDGPGEEFTLRTNESPRIGLIGRFTPQKGQLEFAKAAVMLSSKLPQARFILCGDVAFGDSRSDRYKQEILAAAPPSLEFLGWRDDVYQVLQNLDLLVVPSANEGGVPRVALEAFAAGVPVLASASGAVPEVIQEGFNGYLLSSGTAAAIANRVEELMGQRKVIQQAATRARVMWRDRFTSEHSIRAVRAVLRSVMQRDRF